MKLHSGVHFIEGMRLYKWNESRCLESGIGNFNVNGHTLARLLLFVYPYKILV